MAVALGKAFCAYIAAKTPMNAVSSDTGPVRYVKALSLFLDIRAAMHSDKGTEKTAVETYSRFDLLIIDEIHERGETPFEDRMLTHIIDRRYDAMKPTIIVGNIRSTKLQSSLGASIASRITEGGVVVDCDWEVQRGKITKEGNQ